MKRGVHHNIPFIYAYLFKFILKNMEGRMFQEVTQRYVIDMMHRHIYHIPRVYFSLMVKEMIDYGMIKMFDNKMYVYKEVEPTVMQEVDNAAYDCEENCKETCDKIPFFYLFIFKKMIEKLTRKNDLIDYMQIMDPWKTHIPNLSRVYDHYIIKEMIIYGFIRKVDGHKYIFNGSSAYNKLKKIEEFMPWV